MYVGVMEIGPFKHALYQCDACQRHYNSIGYVGCEGPMVWGEPCSENYCYECFVKVPGEMPLFAMISVE